MNPAEDHARYLAPLTRYILGTNLYVDKKPDTPDALIVVFNTTGYPTIEVLDLYTPGIRRPGMMIHVRGAPGDYAGSRSVAQTIFLALEKKANWVVNGHQYIKTQAVGDIGAPSYDEKNRPNWYLNFEVEY